MIDLDFYEPVTRILSAAACGAIIGWERAASDKPAGLRTNMLVAIGAAAAMIATLDLYESLASDTGNKNPGDPIRIISGVVGGLGFLGAGAIIQSQGQVHGMTTAATIWVVGGIGIACGLGNFVLALTTVVITFLVLFAIGRFEVSPLAPPAVRKDEADLHEAKREAD